MSVDILTATQAGAMANCSAATVFHAVKHGELPAGRFGRALMIQRADVEIWLSRRLAGQKKAAQAIA